MKKKSYSAKVGIRLTKLQENGLSVMSGRYAITVVDLRTESLQAVV